MFCKTITLPVHVDINFKNFKLCSSKNHCKVQMYYIGLDISVLRLI